jgi:hypothetical protein
MRFSYLCVVTLITIALAGQRSEIFKAPKLDTLVSVTACPTSPKLEPDTVKYCRPDTMIITTHWMDSSWISERDTSVVKGKTATKIDQIQEPIKPVEKLVKPVAVPGKATVSPVPVKK